MSYPKFMKRERTSLWVMAYGVYLCLFLSTVVEEGVKHPRAGPEEEPRSDTPVGPQVLPRGGQVPGQQEGGRLHPDR